MTSHVRGRKERLAVVDHDTQIKGESSCFMGKHLFLLVHQFLLHCLIFFSTSRGPLPTFRAAEGVGFATGAEEPTAAGPDRIPAETGGD